MAQVADVLITAGRIDPYLDYLFSEWARVPDLAREWTTWDELDRLTFVSEWPIREDRLHELAQWAQQGLFTPTQRARYAELLRLVAQHRPIIDALLQDEPGCQAE